MRIIYACGEQPWGPSFGGILRDYHLVLGLAREHAVTLVTFGTAGVERGPTFAPLLDACEQIIEVPKSSRTFSQSRQFEDSADARQRLNALFSSRWPRTLRRWESPAFVDALRTVRDGGKVDAVIAARAFVAERALEAGYARVLVDMPDLEYAAMKVLLNTLDWYKSKPIDWAEYSKLRFYERRLPERYWRVMVCKEEDREFLRPRSRSNVFVVPNGTLVHDATPPEAEVPGEMLFVGLLNFYPNIDAIRFFHDQVLPIVTREVPNARFRIIGRREDPYVTSLDNGGNCVVTGSVDDLTPYYARASVVVVPMRLGAGTKLKTVEALSYGKALVTTSSGAEGFDLRPGTDLEVADSPAAFAEACIRLLRDPALRRRLGASGRERTLARYSWPAVTETALAALA